VSWYLC